LEIAVFELHDDCLEFQILVLNYALKTVAYVRNSKTEDKSSSIPGHTKDLSDTEEEDMSNRLKDFARRGSDCSAYEVGSAALTSGGGTYPKHIRENIIEYL
jgi:hypothetical protein